MKHNLKINQRKSIRLNGYDYSKAGLYFITICTHNRENLFGEIDDGKMILNEYGEIVEKEIIKTNSLRKNIKIDEYIIMPNHIHFIIEIVTVGAYGNTPKNEITAYTNIEHGVNHYAPTKQLKSPSKNIGAIVRAIKACSTANINKLRKTTGIPVWQRNYYENIIRDENAHLKIAEYIKNNPVLWGNDRYF